MDPIFCFVLYIVCCGLYRLNGYENKKEPSRVR